MTTETAQAHTAYPHTAQQRRARAVYRTQKSSRRPMVGLLAAELAALALFALAAAGAIGLFSWLTN